MRLRKTPRQRQVQRTLAALERGEGPGPSINLDRARLFCALLTKSPSPGDSIADLQRPTYPDYRDAQIDGWTAPRDGSSHNVNELTFGTCTADSSTVIAFAVYDDDDGTIISSGKLVPPVEITPNVTPTFSAGAMRLETWVTGTATIGP